MKRKLLGKLNKAMYCDQPIYSDDIDGFNPDDFEEVEEEKEIEPLGDEYLTNCSNGAREMQILLKLNEVIKVLNQLKRGGR